ncbi:hypothetical protein [Telmatospirillum siberiense]|uniref:Uncharacterized protein n=1 Tax=Telmatospirillum siberiense TaxID=382514 RepID=A0A2N3PX62_9PROT|nr:hypothetical protein [Telmatospirillum siberiense]PKU24971.1 hypothetical protein CWS72_08865 [Telmatospirillum siberiense]
MWVRQLRDLIGQYRQALLIAAGVMAIAWPLSRHLNNGDEASRALVRVYDNTPHFEWRLVEKPHPTR